MFDKIAMFSQIKEKVESVTGQPFDYILKCLGNAYDSVQKGPGLPNRKAEIEAGMRRIKECYDLGIASGLQPAQAFCVAGHYNQKDNLDIAMQFNQSFSPVTPITEEAVGQIITKAKVSFHAIAVKNGFGEPSEFASVVPPVSGTQIDWQNLL